MSITLYKSCHMQEGNITFQHTFHASNIKTWSPIGLWLIHIKWIRLDLFKVFEANFAAKYIFKKNCRLSQYFYVKPMLNKWEVCLYIKIPPHPCHIKLNHRCPIENDDHITIISNHSSKWRAFQQQSCDFLLTKRTIHP